MDLKGAIKLCGKEIDDFEKAMFHYDSVVRPRAEADRKILDNLRAQYMKLESLQEKVVRGEEPTQQEIFDAVPESLRFN